MSWRTRTVLAATTGVALVGAGALTVAYAADSVPSPTPSSLVSSPTRDPQLDALTKEAHDLQAQVATLEQAVAEEPVPAPAPSSTAGSQPVPVSPAPVEAEPAHVAAPTTEPSEGEHEHESGDHEHVGSDD